jgi:predicted nucleotidyltransferase
MTSVEPKKFGLTERSFTELKQIFAKYPDIREVYLFGSRAKGTYHVGSDIDLAIMNTDVQPRTLVKVLADCHESSLPNSVDLVDFNALTNTVLKEHIQRVGVHF